MNTTTFRGPSKEKERNFYQATTIFKPAFVLAKNIVDTPVFDIFREAIYQTLRHEGVADYYGRNARKAGVTYVQLILSNRVFTIGAFEGADSSTIREAIEGERPFARSASSGTLEREGLSFKPFLESALVLALAKSGLAEGSIAFIAIYEIAVRSYRRTKGRKKRVHA